jgi:hypothetical protein
MDLSLATGAKVSAKSMPNLWEKPLATRGALYSVT